MYGQILLNLPPQDDAIFLSMDSTVIFTGKWAEVHRSCAAQHSRVYSGSKAVIRFVIRRRNKPLRDKPLLENEPLGRITWRR